MNPTSKIAALAAACACASSLTGCDRQGDPGLHEQVALLKAEVAQREDSIKSLRDEFQKEKADSSGSSASSSPAAGGSAAVIDPAKARQSYLARVESLQSSLGQALGSDGTVERASISPVTGPDPDYPISSKVTFTIAAKNGRRGDITIPLVANAAGEWKDTSVSEIAAQVRQSMAAAPALAATPSNPPPTSQPPATQPQPASQPNPTDVMGANRTVKVGWKDDPPATPPARQAPPSQPTQPTPQPPARQPEKPAQQTPTKPMPSNRDVIIDFGH